MVVLYDGLQIGDKQTSLHGDMLQHSIPWKYREKDLRWSSTDLMDNFKWPPWGSMKLILTKLRGV